MADQINRSMNLVRRPVGLPQESDFQLVENLIPVPQEGEILIKTLYFSVDPYMRGRMNDQKSYAPPFELNKPMIARTVGQVIETNNSKFDEGDFVFGFLAMQEYSISDGKELRMIDPTLAPLEVNLSVLGGTGLTAYFGLLDIGKPQAGETVFISGAAGAVGSMVGQIAKIKGCRVVGTAGSDEKVKHLVNDLGFDEGINYKTTPNLQEAVSKACPEGVDVYFDNVGGEITDCILTLINFQARIVLCGQISQYNAEKPEMGPRNLFHLVAKSAMMKGFIIYIYQDRYQEGFQQMAQWLKEGKLQHRETITEGLEKMPQAFLGLFKGENLGKQIIKVAEPNP